MATIPVIVSKMFRVEFHTPVKLEIDGGDEASGVGTMDTHGNRRIEALLFDAHRCRTTPVTDATSSWNSDSDAEIHATIHNNGAPWFDVEYRSVLLEIAMDEALEEFEEACDADTPLKFRPFMSKAIQGTGGSH